MRRTITYNNFFHNKDERTKDGIKKVHYVSCYIT